jgi:phosphatidate cytidylyltransferase
MGLSNNLLRVIVAVIAIPLILAASYFGGIFFFFFTSFIILVSYYEFTRLVLKKGAQSNLWVGLFAIFIFLLNQYKPFIDTYALLLVLTVLILITELFRNKGTEIFNLGTTFLGIFYIGLLGSSLVGIREFYPRVGDLYQRGGWIIISVFASIWVCDSAAYYGGTALGRHKLFLRVSPNKSWEGAIFGFVFAIITMIAAKFLVLDFLSWQTIIVFGFITGIIGQIGDLTESLIKRDAGVKDSSNIIPGHGGIFDRFDSLFLSAPLILFYLKYAGR